MEIWSGIFREEIATPMPLVAVILLMKSKQLYLDFRKRFFLGVLLGYFSLK